MHPFVLALRTHYFDYAVQYSCYENDGAQEHKLLGEREIGANPILSSQR